MQGMGSEWELREEVSIELTSLLPLQIIRILSRLVFFFLVELLVVDQFADDNLWWQACAVQRDESTRRKRFQFGVEVFALVLE